jgi:hypothetical protein
MLSSEVQIGSTVTNGESAVRVTGRAKSDGWIGIFISLGSGKLTGTECLVPIEELAVWQPVPWEWTALEGAGIEHRYVWSANCQVLEHEIRTAERV